MLHTVLFIVLQKSFNMHTIRGADHVHSKIFFLGGACKGPVIKYLLGGVEDIVFGGGVRKKTRTSEGGTKKQQNL